MSPFGYDSVWALALMLNRSVEVLKTNEFEDGTKRKLEDFTYEDREMMLLFFDLLNETDFIGLTVDLYILSVKRNLSLLQGEAH